MRKVFVQRFNPAAGPMSIEAARAYSASFNPATGLMSIEA